MALNFSNNKIIRDNEKSQIWFVFNENIFIGLVLLCGNTHSALKLISSGIYNIKLLD